MAAHTKIASRARCSILQRGIRTPSADWVADTGAVAAIDRRRTGLERLVDANARSAKVPGAGVHAAALAPIRSPGLSASLRCFRTARNVARIDRRGALDLSAGAGEGSVANCIRGAIPPVITRCARGDRELTTVAVLANRLPAHPHRRGAIAVRAALDAQVVAVARVQIEFRLIDRHRLPRRRRVSRRMADRQRAPGRLGIELRSSAAGEHRRHSTGESLQPAPARRSAPKCASEIIKTIAIHRHTSFPRAVLRAAHHHGDDTNVDPAPYLRGFCRFSPCAQC